MKKVYEMQKALNFRTLWEIDDPLVTFRRVASESAAGTGRLNGMVELARVLHNFETTENKAVSCFSSNIYTTGIKRWRLDRVNNKTVCFEKGIPK